MTIKNEFKSIIKDSDDKELLIKHIIYYLFRRENSCSNNIELFNEFNDFYMEKFNYVDILLDKIVERYNYKLKDTSPGKLYEQLTTAKFKKTMGQVYTPVETIKNMIDLSGLNNKKIDSNFKIIDISCGSGYFLIELIEVLKNRGLEIKNIIKNNIFGVDIDRFSVFLTKLTIMNRFSEINYKDLNIFHEDILLIKNKDLKQLKFDLVIGNPPYIGHKNIESGYRKKLYEEYITFTNKSDISFCFFEKAERILKNNGIVTLITSRYFLEGDNAYQIRKFLKSKFQINEIIDYNGYKLFKNANISPLIIKLTKDQTIGQFKYSYKEKETIKTFSFNQNNLNNKKWIIRPQEDINLLRKLYKESDHIVEEYIEFKQGIISGYDKAFVLNLEEVEKHKIEKSLLKKWIKNSDIKDKGIRDSSKRLLYIKDINIEEYPNTFKYLLPYKERLKKRRECKKGLIKWYEIQWPREQDIFEKNKILFPYKAKKPKFIFDEDRHYCSADIYIAIKKYSVLDYALLEKYFNSKIFNYICKMELKKVGEDLLEFYPYSIKSLPIINKKYLIDFDSSGYIKYEDYLNKIFNLSKKEIDIINRHTWRST